MAAMAEKTKPLAGYTLGVTADRRADEQISLLEGRGAKCIHGPTIRTHPLRPEAEIKAVTDRFLADPPSILVATTGLGVRGWLEAADALQLGTELREALAQCRVFARGPKAHGAAVTAELSVEWSGKSATTAEVLERIRPEIKPGDRVAVQVDGAPGHPLIGAIEELGANVLTVPIYRWELPADTTRAEVLIRAVAEEKVDGITFTARPAAENFVILAEQMGLVEPIRAAMTSTVKTFCVGPVCAEGVATLDIGRPIQPERFRLGAMVMSITKTFEAQHAEVEIGGLAVRLQGKMLAIGGGEPTMLTDRERQVLDILVERPGVVHSKEALLKRVWGAGERDTHVVEVTVGRLRKRLGEAGVGIETVVRRGYRASPT